MKTVLVTGCSSGYGLATAQYFHERGWRVVAGMRAPKERLLPTSERMRIVPLDVTRAESIAAAVAEAGPLDALVNNAGIGLASAFEATPMATTREIFETNTFGTMAMVQAVLPGLRARGRGTIVNVTSSAVLAPMPLVAAYTASKTAIEGFTASLALELAAVGIAVKIVQPGYGPGTSFTSNGLARMEGLVSAPYAAYAESVFASYASVGPTTVPSDVAEAVWEAVNDTSDKLRFPAGADAIALAASAAR